MLTVIDNLLSEEELQAIGQQLAAAQWLDGRRSAGGIAAEVKSNLQLDPQQAPAANLGPQLLQRLAGHPLFVSAALPRHLFPPRFNCYREGGEYGLHVDSAVLTLPDQQLMRSDLSATLFLVDPDTYEGGELVMETQFGAQEIKLAAGSLVLYPSSSLHRVTPVHRGQRLAAFFWVQSLVRNAQQREQLFELDQSVQALTLARGADDAEVRRLSGVYHNLLRMWADA